DRIGLKLVGTAQGYKFRVRVPGAEDGPINGGIKAGFPSPGSRFFHTFAENNLARGHQLGEVVQSDCEGPLPKVPVNCSWLHHLRLIKIPRGEIEEHDLPGVRAV